MTLEQELAALGNMNPAQLRAEWRRVHRRETPPHSPDLMARAIAWKRQASLYGDLTSATRRTLDQLVRELGDGIVAGPLPSTLAPGTRLVRDWNGRTLHVLVTDSGFVFEHRHYRSLTQIARHVTGARWSGPRFFGLVKRNQGGVPSAKGKANGQAVA